MEKYTGGRVVSSQLAKKLKEVGYTTYDFIGLYKGDVYFGPESDEGIDLDNFNLGEYEFLAPLQCDVQKWLKSTHGLEVRLYWEWATAGVNDSIKLNPTITGERVKVSGRIFTSRDMTHIGPEMDKLLLEALNYIRK